MEISHEVIFSLKTYNLDTIKKAAYRFTGQLAFNFLSEEDNIVCNIVPLSGLTASEVESTIGEFKNEVLDQDLRRTIADETSAARNLILAHVFSKTGLQGNE